MAVSYRKRANAGIFMIVTSFQAKIRHETVMQNKTKKKKICKIVKPNL